MISMLFCAAFAAGGIVFGTIADSLIVSTNGLIAAVETLSAALFIAAVEQTAKSADFKFNYGYGKYESLAVLASAVLLAVIGLYVLAEAIADFGLESKTESFGWLAAYSFLNFAVMSIMAKLMKSSAKKHKMPILKFDAELWETDSWLELAVVANLLLGAALNHFHFGTVAKYLDSASAVALLAYALSVPLRHGKHAVNQILDKTIDEEMQMQILATVVGRFDSFCEFKALHTRQSGKDIFIEIDLILPFDYTLEQKKELEDSIAQEIKHKHPTAIMRLYAQPCPRDCIRDGQCFCPIKSRQNKQ